MLIQTHQKREIVDITDQINEEVKKAEVDDGLCNLFVVHTTCALTIADLDPETAEDYLNVFDNLIPKLDFKHPHDPQHVPDHILSSMIGVSLTIPIMNGELILGTWQKVVLVEFDGPRERELVLKFF